MPMLDVSQALTNPLFQDTFDVIRRTEVIGSNGRSTPTISVIKDVQGVVTPSGDNSIVQEDSHERGNRGIMVITQFRLQGIAPGIKPDIIVWNGGQYQVGNIEDYSRYGSGFVSAQASSVLAVDPQIP